MTRAALRAKITQTLFFCSLFLFALGLLFFTRETSAAAFDSLILCSRVLIPCLFPFMVVSNLAVSSSAAQKVGQLFKKPMSALFNVPGEGAAVFVLGLVGGYPVGAANAVLLYRSGLCTKTQTERLLAFCNNCGPAFILGVVGSSLFGTTKAGLLLYGSHIISSILVGLIFRFYKRGEMAAPDVSSSAFSTKGPNSLPFLFTSAVKNSVPAVLNVCAYVIFFSVAVKLLYISGIIPAAASFLSALLRPLDLSSDFMGKLISGIFEMSGGVYGMASAKALLSSRLAAVAFLLSWAGLSVHFQVLDFIGDCNLSSLPYIAGKLLHGIFSAILVYVGTLLIPFDTEVSKTLAGQISAIYDTSPLVIFALSAFFALAIWGAFSMLRRGFCKKSEKKIERTVKKSYNHIKV